MDWIAWDAQIEADLKFGKLDKLTATARRRYRELVDGEVEAVPGPLVFARLSARLNHLIKRCRGNADSALSTL